MSGMSNRAYELAETPGFEDCLVLPAKNLDDGGVAPEGLDDLLSADGFLGHTIQLAEVLLQIAKTFPGVFCHESGEPDHDGHHHQARKGKPVIEDEHRGEDAQHCQGAGDERGHVLRNGLIDGVDVVCESAHQAAGGVRVEEFH